MLPVLPRSICWLFKGIRNELKSFYWRHRAHHTQVQRGHNQPLPPINGYEVHVLMPASAAAVAKIPAPVIVADTAHNAEDAAVYHLLIALTAAASDAVRPLSTRLTTTALKIAMGAIPSDRVVTNGISWWPTKLPPATATPLAPAINRCHYCHYYLAATARVITRRDHRHSRNCGKQLQKAEILWEISNPVWLDLMPALWASLRSRAAEEAAQAALAEGMAAAQHARASHSVVVVLSTNGAIGLLCHVKI